MAITIKLYKVTDDAHVVSKSLGTAKEYSSCVLKDTTEVLNPLLLIQTTDNLSDYNYAYIEDFGRYYFIKPTTVVNGLWSFTSHVDVLMSHKAELLSLRGTLVRSETTFNAYLNDPEYKSLAYRKIVTKKFPNAMTGDCFILMTVG